MQYYNMKLICIISHWSLFSNIFLSTLTDLSHLGTVFIFIVQHGPNFYLINNTVKYLKCLFVLFSQQWEHLHSEDRMWHCEDWWALLTATETCRRYAAILMLGYVKLVLWIQFHIEILNRVRVSSEIDHALKWDGLRHEQLANKEKNHLYCWIHLVWQQLMNKKLL